MPFGGQKAVDDVFNVFCVPSVFNLHTQFSCSLALFPVTFTSALIQANCADIIMILTLEESAAGLSYRGLTCTVQLAIGSPSKIIEN